jgi:DNA topoisomerase IA
MTSTLIIVETQKKSETINKFLPSGYKCINTCGSMRYIPKELASIQSREINYKRFDDPKKSRIHDLLRREISDSKDVIIATDNDDEGELQAWHIVTLYKLHVVKRLQFCEITYDAFVSSPILRAIDMEKVRAYEMGLAMDMLYGYTFSPVLWENIPDTLHRKEKKRPTASRRLLQALHSLQENDNISCEEEMKVVAYFTNMQIPFEKAITNDESSILQFLQKSLYHNHIFTREEPKKTINPGPDPLDTPTLLKDLHSLAPASQIISACQYLYESGYITFYKTVIKQISCTSRIKEYIVRRYGEQYVKDVVPNTSSSGEAIRPTDINLVSMKEESPLIRKVYQYIWLRTIQSCMCDSVIYTITANVISPTNDLYTHRSKHIANYGYLKADSEMDSNSPIYFYLLKLTQVSILQFQSITTRLSVNYFYNTEKTLLNSNPCYYFTVDKLLQRGYITVRPSAEMYTHLTTYKLQDSTITQSSPQILSTVLKFTIHITELGNAIYKFINKYFAEFYCEETKGCITTLRGEMMLAIDLYNKNVFQVEHSGITIGEYMNKKVYIKRGKYGLYLEWQKETKTLSRFGNRPMENIRFDEIVDILEEMKKQLEPVIEMAVSEKKTNIIRQVTNDISIRNGKHGHYIFYQTHKMGKPLFFGLKDCAEDYEACSLETLKTWILLTHHIK